MLSTCAELGTGFVACSPIGRGFPSGRIRSVEDLASDDFRRRDPRFQGEALEQDLRLVDRVREIADEEGVTASHPADVRLTDDDLRRLDEAAPVGAAAGDRYPDTSGVHL